MVSTIPRRLRNISYLDKLCGRDIYVIVTSVQREKNEFTFIVDLTIAINIGLTDHLVYLTIRQFLTYE
jgi:hypothetical protein